MDDPELDELEDPDDDVDEDDVDEDEELSPEDWEFPADFSELEVPDDADAADSDLLDPLEVLLPDSRLSVR